MTEQQKATTADELLKRAIHVLRGILEFYPDTPQPAEICARCGKPRSALCGDDFIPMSPQPAAVRRGWEDRYYKEPPFPAATDTPASAVPDFARDSAVSSTCPTCAAPAVRFDAANGKDAYRYDASIMANLETALRSQIEITNTERARAERLARASAVAEPTISGELLREVEDALGYALIGLDAATVPTHRKIAFDRVRRVSRQLKAAIAAPPPIARSDAAPVAQEVSNAIRARDRLYCEAIIATLDSSGPRLVNDTERMLHHFNTHRPDQTDALALATKPAGASGVADMQAIRDRLECALAQYFHLCAAGEKGRLKARLHAAREIDAMLDALAASSDTPVQGAEP